MLKERPFFLQATGLTLHPVQISCWRRGRLVQATNGLALSPVQNVMLKERPFFLQATGLTLHPVQNAMLEKRQACTSHWLNFTPCSKCHVGGEAGDYNVLAKQYTLHMVLLEERQTCITHIDLDTIYEE